MKKIFLAVLLFCSINASAQKIPETDSVYYLVDTVKTAANDRLWDIHEEYPSFKVYTIQCPCLQYNRQPSFIYDTKQVKGRVVSKDEFKTIKLSSLVSLIVKAKQFTSDDFKGKYAIFFIEPAGRQYILYKVRLLRPTRTRDISIDYENVPPPDSTEKKRQKH